MRAIPDDLGQGGYGMMPGWARPGSDGQPTDLFTILRSMMPRVATAAAAEAITRDERNGLLVVGKLPFWWNAASLANDVTKQIAIRPTDVASNVAGRWESLSTSHLLALPVSKDTTNGAVLFTVPAGFRLLLERRPFYDNTIAWTGGTASAIGIKSSNAAYAGDGDIQGGASGDLAAALGTGIKWGTLGTKFGSDLGVVLEAGDTILFQRLVSAFTAGSGTLYVPVKRFL